MFRKDGREISVVKAINLFPRCTPYRICRFQARFRRPTTIMGAEAVLAPKGGDFPKTFPPKKNGGNMYIRLVVRFRVVNPN